MELEQERAAIGVLDEILDERRLQHAKWGEQNWPDGTGLTKGILSSVFRDMCDACAAKGTVSWAHILLEEVAEAMDERDHEKLRAELVQAVAVGVAWIEAIDRKAGQ